MADKIVVLNRGPRTFHLKPGADKAPRTLVPGGSIETLDDAEAKQLLAGYPTQIADAAKVVPHNAAKLSALQAEVDRLKAENAKLSAKSDGVFDEDEKEKDGKGGKGGKGGK